MLWGHPPNGEGEKEERSCKWDADDSSRETSVRPADEVDQYQVELAHLREEDEMAPGHVYSGILRWSLEP